MLVLNNISFRYDADEVLKSISIKIPQGSHLSVIGASGCGKSTLLKIIYGLYSPLTGTIHRNDKPLLGPDFNIIPGEDFMKFVAQDFDLMPFITARENVGKYLSNFYPEEKEQRSLELLETVEMTAFADIKPQYLSGGQQQRIALARALAKEPEILLLDEPFSHIDNFQKNNLRRKLFAYLKEKNITCIVATHDSTDALSFADTALILNKGNIVASGPPQSLFLNPPDAYTASLFGDVNVFDASLFTAKTQKQTICIYPHELKVDARGILKVQVVKSYFKGSHWLIEAKFNEMNLLFEHPASLEKETHIRLQPLTEVLQRRV